MPEYQEDYVETVINNSRKVFQEIAARTGQLNEENFQAILEIIDDNLDRLLVLFVVYRFTCKLYKLLDHPFQLMELRLEQLNVLTQELQDL